MVDPQVFKIINDIYTLLKTKTAAELNEVDVAFMSGQLKTLIDLFTDPQQEDKPRKDGWLRNLLP
jgi:hypothetical protein